VTQPQPFALKTDKRGQEYQSSFRAFVEEEEHRAVAQSHFHAHPIPATIKAPFVPKPSNKPVTEPENVRLNSDRRHNERAAFEKAKQEKEEQARIQKELAAAEAARQEQEEIKRLRAQMVVKAKPVAKGSAVIVHRSEVPLTQPKTPLLKTRARATVRV
jgi:hypothetical protein